jgi:hypothetical protein
VRTEDNRLRDCFLHPPSSESMIPFVLGYKRLRDAQVGDARLQKLLQRHSRSFADQCLRRTRRFTYFMPQTIAPWKIRLPSTLLNNAVRWYHNALGHPGQSRPYDTKSLQLYHLNLIKKVVSKNDTCQRLKNMFSEDMVIQLLEKRQHRLLLIHQNIENTLRVLQIRKPMLYYKRIYAPSHQEHPACLGYAQTSCRYCWC